MLMAACTSTVSYLQSFAAIGTQGEKHSSREGLQRPPQERCGTDASFVCDFAFSVSQSERNITFAVLGGGGIKRANKHGGLSDVTERSSRRHSLRRRCFIGAEPPRRPRRSSRAHKYRYEEGGKS